MEEEAADKLNGSDGGVREGVIFSIFIAEADHAVCESADAAVGDGDPMSVAGEVVKHVVRLINGLAHTDHPFMVIERFFKGFVIPREGECSTVDGAGKGVDKFSAEDQ